MARTQTTEPHNLSYAAQMYSLFTLTNDIHAYFVVKPVETLIIHKKQSTRCGPSGRDIWGILIRQTDHTDQFATRDACGLDGLSRTTVKSYIRLLQEGCTDSAKYPDMCASLVENQGIVLEGYADGWLCKPKWSQKHQHNIQCTLVIKDHATNIQV